MIIKNAPRLAFAVVCLTAITTSYASHAQMGYWPPPGPYGPAPGAYGLPQGPYGPPRAGYGREGAPKACSATRSPRTPLSI